MAAPLKTGKKSVELRGEVRPSRIRRDPVHTAEQAKEDKRIRWTSDEWEIRLAIIGIIAFALAINIITFGISAITGD